MRYPRQKFSDHWRTAGPTSIISVFCLVLPGGQSLRHPGEDTPFAAAPEPMAYSRSPTSVRPVAEGLARAMFPVRVAFPQPVAIYEDYFAWTLMINNPWHSPPEETLPRTVYRFSDTLGKEPARPRPLRVRQP